LIQEDLYPNEWAILVSCMMLNCTSRKQVEKVLPEFLKRWPGPQQFMEAPVTEVVDLCRPLGFANRRTINLKKMTEAYLAGGWQHARELPGIGEYAAAAWEIFCLGVFSEDPPKDHALVQYHEWARQYKFFGRCTRKLETPVLVEGTRRVSRRT
jgi:methyl-CpG-binding domain protein 4